MTLLCSVAGHCARTTHHHNQGLDFTLCHRCGCDLVRAAGSDEWTEVPKGFRVVWRNPGRTGDAASVASRMHRDAAPPRRRAPRNARPQPRRDSRGRPLSGATSLFGTLAVLGKLIACDEPVEDCDGATAGAVGQYVICLPGGAG